MESAPELSHHSSLSSSFKLKRSETFKTKRPRLLDGLEYQSKFTDAELQVKLTNYLSQKQYVETSLIELLETAAITKTNKFIPKSVYDTLSVVLERIKCLPVLYYAITKNFEHMNKENSRTDWKTLYNWDMESLVKQQNTMFETYPHLDSKLFVEVVEGERILCSSAV